MAFTWVPPPPPPPAVYVAGRAVFRTVLPFLLLLPLFLFPANRAAKAWWLGLPVGVAALIGITLICLTVNAEVSLQQVVVALVTGLGAVWLLAPRLRSRYRIAMFFKTLFLLAGFSGLAFGMTQLAGSGGWIEFWPYLASMLGCASLAVTLALTLAGFSVRRRFGRVRFLLWLAVWILLAWTAIMTPIFIITSWDSTPDWNQLIIAIPITSGITLALLLPLVLLAFFQPFYRTRLLELLNLTQPGTPAEVAAPPVLVELAQPPSR